MWEVHQRMIITSLFVLEILYVLKKQVFEIKLEENASFNDVLPGTCRAQGV